MSTDSARARAEARTRSLGEGALRGTLFRLSLPAIIGMSSNALYNVVDSIFIGRLGTTALGAVAIAFPIFALIGAIGISFGMGAASFVSRRLGAGDRPSADRALSAAVVSVIVIGLSISAVGLVFLEPLLRLFGATDTIVPYAMQYARVLVAGSTIIMLKICFNNVVRAEGNTRWSMIGMVTGAGLNIVLDPILIFGAGLGITGAAWATIISQSVSLALLAGYFVLKRSYVRFNLLRFRLPLAHYREIVWVGTPMFFRQALASMGIALLNTLAAPYGDAAVGALGIALRVMIFGMMPVYGFGQGYQPMAGYNYGAGYYRRLFGVVRLSLTWTTVYATALAALLVSLAPTVVRFFSADPEVVAIGARGMRFIFSAFPVFGVQVISMVSFQALGKPMSAMLIGLARQGLFLVPIALLLSLSIGLDGVLAAQGVSDLLTGLLAGLLGLGLLRQLRREERTRDRSISPAGVKEATEPVVS